MHPRFGSPDDGTGLEVVDPAESNRYVLYTPEPVSPEPADTDPFVYPVSVARRIVTPSLRLSYNVPSTVRNADDGSYIAEIGHDNSLDLAADDYLLGIDAPVKLYARVNSSLDIDATANGIEIRFDGAVPVDVGARSAHTAPSETITVPDDPEAAMAAVSTFGSALKTTSPERAWPTLRGHPPSVERGDTLAIPDGLEVPDTGVTLRVPADYDYLYPVAPLAHYLGADVAPADSARLTTDDGFVHELGGDGAFEDEVARVLKQVFVLDCATRTEGFHPVELTERRAVESVADLDFEALYEAPLGERLAAYLSVPEAVVAAAKPTWSRVTHVRPVAETVELLPFVADRLSVVRTKPAAPDGSPAGDGDRAREREAVRSFKRSSSFELSSGRRDEPTGVPEADEYVPLPDVDAVEQAWVGDGTPVHGTKLLASAFRHDPTTSTDGVTDVTVVCNDDGMREEWEIVSDAYGTRDVVPFEVDRRFGVDTDELRALLAADHDLFHFIGHIDGRGFECPDGVLDAESLAETGATTMLLNACRSHDQGVELVEAGAHAAIVSWGDVDNSGAVEVGEAFARLLNHGFPVGVALTIVEEYTSIGRHYVVVGNPDVSIAQSKSGTAELIEVDCDPDAPASSSVDVDATSTCYPSPPFCLGSVVTSYLTDDSPPEFSLVPRTRRFETSPDELERLLGDELAPIVVDGELRWAKEWFGDDRRPE